MAIAGAAVMAPILGVQCFLARTALGWSLPQLGRAAGVASHTVRCFERGDSVRPSTVEAIQGALEKAGVIFIDANDGGPGARLAKGRFLAVADTAITERELEAARTARAVRTARADARAADLAPIIAELQADGVASLRGIAAELNRRGIPTATGRGEWSGKQVARVLARLA
jgi:transcriptional regulator with XRE-family HTH domain